MNEHTLCRGSPIAINATAVSYSHPADDHIMIHLTSGSINTVTEATISLPTSSTRKGGTEAET